MKKFVQLVGLLLLYAICAVGLSLCYGILAKELYHALKNKVDLENIKVIIDVVTSFITFLVLPFFIYWFWQIMKSLRRITWKTYFMLLAVLIAFYSIGMLFMIASHYVSMEGNMQGLKYLMILVLAIGNLYITGKVCIRGGQK